MKPEYELKTKSVKIINTIYHTVPNDWQVFSLNNFAHELKERFSTNRKGPILSVTKYKGFVESLKYFKKQIYSKDIKKYKLVERGDFAYATIHLDEGSLGLLKEFDRGYISPMYTVFRTNSIIDKDFLYYLLKSNGYIQIYKSLGEGSINRRKSISFDDLSRLKLPIPALNEQKKIASIISKVENLIKKIDQIIEQSESLKRGLINKLVTKGLDVLSLNDKDLPDNYRSYKLAQVVTINPRYKLEKYKEYQFAEMAAINEKTKSIDYFGIRSPSSGYAVFRNDDILFARITPCTENGKVSLVRGVEGIGMGSTELVVLSPKNKDQLLPEFLYFYCQTDKVRNYAISQMRGATGRQRVPDTVFTADLFIILPNLERQKQDANIITQIENFVRQYQIKRNAVDDLKKGLTQKLLTGKIRVKF